MKNMTNIMLKAIPTCALSLLLAAPASASVRYNLTNVVTAVGQYPTGIVGSGSLLGYFVLDNKPTPKVTEYIITSVYNGAVNFEWSSFPGFPHPSITNASFNAATNVWDIFFMESLGGGHGVTLDLAFDPSKYDPFSGAIPLIPSSDGTTSTSSWYEIINSDYAAYGYVKSGAIAAIPEPASIALVALGLGGLIGCLTRRKV